MSTMLTTELYQSQTQRWPPAGRHILAQYDASSIVVYQAYNAAIASHAVTHQRFGGPLFSHTRMTWIKPNFLWMMYRSGWATKVNQERVLAIRISRAGFEEMLGAAVASSFGQTPGVFGSKEEWKEALESSEVRLQWDPDHELGGRKVGRRAIQLGVRGEMQRRYCYEFCLGIEDITEFVRAQAGIAEGGEPESVVTPREEVYPVPDDLKAGIGLDADQ